ncbi:hypothetical protein B0T18DRAFT_68425 [Schizothecium vesticola]|uniref:Uncharacterized protein n=1 Tax=Schizothecium vesticola TaxID=314040 RepID=A0AA40F578_9PEZI|nr:hypothetical protein B0T18DRAFT_68425 [Schizothecium vesticola]
MMKSAIFHVGARLVPLCLVFYSPFCSASAAPSCSADAVTPWAMLPAAMDVCFWEENTAWLDDNATAEEENSVAGRLEDNSGGGGVVVSSAAVDDKDGDPLRRGAAACHRITYLSGVLVAEQLLLLELVEQGFMISTLNAHWNLMGHFCSVLAGGLGFAMLSIRVWRWIRNLKRSAWTSRSRKEAWRATREYCRSWTTVTSKAMRFLAEDWSDRRAQPVPSWATQPPPTHVGVAVGLCAEVRWWLWMVWLGVSTLTSDLCGELCGTTTTTTTTTTQPPLRVTQPTPQPPPGVTRPTPEPYTAEDWHAWRVYPVRTRPAWQQRPAIQGGIRVWARRVWSDVRWWIWFVWFGISTFCCELRKELRRAELDDSDEEELQPTTASATRRPMAASATRLPKGAKAARRKAMKPRPW